ncbi:sigma intracellular receptor 2 isoform X2 [Hemicordylus capensis]|uniref:sigma intracellular receptor 2 isoform X2 n=1 Tax=Hemicordylus capensis TaxID=884348 RepID=UPI002304C892|nr:sigma intracellular receptor 2 isoform X2 [Hemicordylus capensis]
MGDQMGLTEVLKWYTAEFKDPLMLDPPAWFFAFLCCEAVFQLPFFFVATYAFFKGSCKWIRTPAIIYATHVVTSFVVIVPHILFSDFSKSKHAGPETLRHRLTLLSIYAPYLLIPLLVLFTMLLSPVYNQVEKRKKN